MEISFDTCLTYFSFLFLSAAIISSLGVILDCLVSQEGFDVFDSNRKVGGIRFLKLGRINLSISVSRKGG